MLFSSIDEDESVRFSFNEPNERMLVSSIDEVNERVLLSSIDESVRFSLLVIFSPEVRDKKLSLGDA